MAMETALRRNEVFSAYPPDVQDTRGTVLPSFLKRIDNMSRVSANIPINYFAPGEALKPNLYSYLAPKDVLGSTPTGSFFGNKLFDSILTTVQVYVQVSIDENDSDIAYVLELSEIEGQLRIFESTNKISSDEFYKKWLVGAVPDTFDNNVWAGLYEVRNKLVHRE